MRHEVVYTLSRALTDAEWQAATALVERWWGTPADGDTVQITSNELVVQCADSEDLRVERGGAIAIWSARARSVRSAQRLAGVVLCLQFAWGAEVLQMSGNNLSAFSRAAAALTPVWGGAYDVVEIRPAAIKADPLLFVDAGAHRAQMHAFYRAALELDAAALPDSAFAEQRLR
ncbi:MAG: hypothetical protein K2R93_15170 [Gemmatimonadaceae bacterium]|nr:hypothetical protein [Gemmatimonadaceae bacterium]